MRVIIFADLAGARECIDGIDRELGLPRTPTEADVARVGGGIHVPLAEIQASRSWQTYAAPLGHSDGRGAVLYNEAILRPLEGRTLDLGGGRTRVLREADAVTLATTAERDAWTTRTRR